MKIRKMIRTALIRMAAASIPTTSRSGFFQNDMRALRAALEKRG